MSNKLLNELRALALNEPVTAVNVWFETDNGLPTVYQTRGSAGCLLEINALCISRGWPSIFDDFLQPDEDDDRTPVQRAIEAFEDMEMYIESVRFGREDLD